MMEVGLQFEVVGTRTLVLRELTGADERASGGDVHLLLAALAAPAGGGSGPDVGRLSVGDRDRVLAALYAELYGDAVVADALCVGCDKKFELRFRLSAMVAARSPDGSATGTPPAVEVGGARYRLPVVADLQGGAGDLLARLHLDGPEAPPEAVEAVEAALEAADPALALDLSGTCPECGTTQETPFSIAGFLAAALRRDAAFLRREIHVLARGYGWGLGEILSLTRQERQDFVRLILGERQASAQVRSLA